MRSLIGAVTLSVVALAPVTASAADGWVLWERESRMDRAAPSRTIAVHADKAACLDAALVHVTARRDRPAPPGVPAEYRDDFATEAGPIGLLRNGQGYSVILITKKTRVTLLAVAECWPVGANPQ